MVHIPSPRGSPNMINYRAINMQRQSQKQQIKTYEIIDVDNKQKLIKHAMNGQTRSRSKATNKMWLTNTTFVTQTKPCTKQDPSLNKDQDYYRQREKTNPQKPGLK